MNTETLIARQVLSSPTFWLFVSEKLENKSGAVNERLLKVRVCLPVEGPAILEVTRGICQSK